LIAVTEKMVHRRNKYVQIRSRNETSPQGFEPNHVSAESNNYLTNHSPQDVDQSGAVGAQSGAIAPELQLVIDIWTELPAAVRASIVALVKSR